MKPKFKVGDLVFKKGDLVRHKQSPGDFDSYEIGMVIKIEAEYRIKVHWLSSGVYSWFSPLYLEFAETPIQRMKRKYSEEK